MIKVTVWYESMPEEEDIRILKVYSGGLGAAIASIYGAPIFEVRNAYLTQEEDGLSTEVLDATDVLVWWGHSKHHLVSDLISARVISYVQRGMGIIFLHSAHASKPFIGLMGTSCTLKWREDAEKEWLWITNPSHKIVQGIRECFAIPHEEMYGEYFDIPEPDELIFIGWFKGGNVFRSGVTYRRGLGKVFYFQPGHETHPIYFQPEIQRILANAAEWAAPVLKIEKLDCPNSKISLEQI